MRLRVSCSGSPCAGLDRIYDDFTTKVADGRHLPKDKILQIAKGRIWSGQDAKDLGLVDELGGYDTALKLAKESAGILANDGTIPSSISRHRKEQRLRTSRELGAKVHDGKKAIKLFPTVG